MSALRATAGGLGAYQLFSVTRHPVPLQWLCRSMLGVAEHALSSAMGNLFGLGHWRGHPSPPGPTCCIQPLLQSTGDMVEQVEYTTWIDKVKDILVVISNVLGN